MPDDAKDDDPPLSLATINQIVAELQSRVDAMVLAMRIKEGGDGRDGMYGTFSGDPTTVMGLAYRQLRTLERLDEAAGEEDDEEGG